MILSRSEGFFSRSAPDDELECVAGARLAGETGGAGSRSTDASGLAGEARGALALGETRTGGASGGAAEAAGGGLVTKAGGVLALRHGGVAVGLLGGDASKAAGVDVVLTAVKGVEVAVHGSLAESLVLVVTGVTLAVVALHHVLESSANVLGLALEAVVALATAAENTTLLLELGHGHGRELRGLVVGSSVVVDLVDGDGSVDDVGLDGLLVDDGLDGLVDVVVDVLAADGSVGALAVGGSLNYTLVLEGGLLGSKVPLGGIGIPVVELAVLDGTKLGSVLLGKNLAVVDGLNSAVVVVLVNLLVNSGVDLLVNMRLDNLLLHCGRNSLVDSGVMVTRLGHEVADCCLSLLHCD